MNTKLWSKYFTATFLGAFLLLLSGCGSAELVLAVPDHPQSAGETWNGEVDERWYDAALDTYELSTAQQLAGLARLVNRGVSMQGKKMLVGESIILWYRIASFLS